AASALPGRPVPSAAIPASTAAQPRAPGHRAAVSIPIPAGATAPRLAPANAAPVERAGNERCLPVAAPPGSSVAAAREPGSRADAQARPRAGGRLAPPWSFLPPGSPQRRWSFPAHAVSSGAQNRPRAGAESFRTPTVAARPDASPNALSSPFPGRHLPGPGTAGGRANQTAVSTGLPLHRGHAWLLSGRARAGPFFPPQPVRRPPFGDGPG